MQIRLKFFKQFRRYGVHKEVLALRWRFTSNCSELENLVKIVNTDQPFIMFQLYTGSQTNLAKFQQPAYEIMCILKPYLVS